MIEKSRFGAFWNVILEEIGDTFFDPSTLGATATSLIVRGALTDRGTRRPLRIEMLEDRRQLAALADTSITFNAGILAVTDTATNGKNDNLDIGFDGTNYTVADTSGSLLSTSIGSGNNTASVLLPATSLTGITEFRINTNNGDDFVKLDSSFAAFTGKVTINGGQGTDTTEIDAALNLTNALQVNSTVIDLNAPLTAPSISGTASTDQRGHYRQHSKCRFVGRDQRDYQRCGRCLQPGREPGLKQTACPFDRRRHDQFTVGLFFLDRATE